MKKLLFFVVFICAQCTPSEKKTSVGPSLSTDEIKKELLALEQNWLEAEFNLDTSYIAKLIDSTFIGISADHLTNRKRELKGMYANISAMRENSIFLDSLKLEDGLVNLYGNTAMVTFIVHTYKKDKGQPTEKRTRFYDVWVNRNGKWKAVAAQGTLIDEIKSIKKSN